MNTMTATDVVVTGGVDTHQDLHVAAALDQLGRVLATESFPTTLAGYRRLLAWLRRHGQLAKVGVEGTGSYGAALARHLAQHDVEVIEVARPNRQVRRRFGKTDVIDAIAAARAVQSGEATGTPKSHDGPVEALRTLKAVQRSANKARTQALNQIHQMLVTAPEDLRARLRPLPRRQLLQTCSAFRISPDDDSLQAMTRLALRELAQRVLHLDGQLALVTKRLHRITAAVAPQLMAIKGVGPEVASTLLTTAGDNPERMHSEAAFAALCGSNPIPASSGKTTRHRLNRAGDRHANAALWRIVIVRLSTDPRTRAYLAKRMAEGKTKTEAIRCLKRYVAREIYSAMPASSATG
jgi:transposase